MSATVNISLPESMKDEIDAVVATEGYGNTSEFFRDLVRDYLEERRKRKLEDLILEGLRSGEPLPFTTDDIEQIKKRGLERIAQRLAR
jgi:antitoxin ParD1/3/4